MTLATSTAVADAARRSLIRSGAIRARTPARIKARVVAAFHALANGVDAATARARTTDFYRSGGMAWARRLG